MHFTFFALLWTTPVLLAQINAFTGDLRSRDSATSIPLAGVITGPSKQDMPQLRVELIDINSRQLRAESIVSSSGSFSFGAVPLGLYELRVTNLVGGLLYSREIQTNLQPQLLIHLPSTTPGNPGSISLRRLQHQVPKPARKLASEAEKLFRQGQQFAALNKFQAAVALDPDFYEALANLGALELVANRPADAVQHLSHALALDPQASHVAANLAAAYLLLSQFPAAEAAARQSIDANPHVGRSRYLLALSLLKQDRVTPEALNQLQLARKDFPAAADLLKVVLPQLVQQ